MELIRTKTRKPETEDGYLFVFDNGFIATASWIDSDWELSDGDTGNG